MSDFGVNRPVSESIWLFCKSASLIEASLENLHAQYAEYNEQKQ